MHVLLCDDDDLICECLEERLLLEPLASSVPIGVSPCLNGAEALTLAAQQAPDLALIDLNLHQQALSGLDVLEALQREQPQIRRVALTAFGKDLSEADWLRLQACELQGFINKNNPSRGFDYQQTCLQIMRGRPYFDALYLLRMQALAQTPAVPQSGLSPRQREVLLLRAQGLSLAEIARQLNLSEGSVKTYLQRIQQQLEIRTPVELLRYAQSQGWPV